MRTFLKILTDIFGIPELRRRVLITFALLGVYRIGFHIYLPGIKIELDGTCLQIIGNTVEFTGDSGIGSSCDDVDVQTITAGGKGSLVE